MSEAAIDANVPFFSLFEFEMTGNLLNIWFCIIDFARELDRAIHGVSEMKRKEAFLIGFPCKYDTTIEAKLSTAHTYHTVLEPVVRKAKVKDVAMSLVQQWMCFRIKCLNSTENVFVGGKKKKKK